MRTKLKETKKKVYFFKYFIRIQIGLEEKIAQDDKIDQAHARRQNDGECAPNRHDRVNSNYVENNQRAIFDVGQILA